MRYIFIFGPHRSGTTLLRELLSKHSYVKSTPNDLNIPRVVQKGYSPKIYEIRKLDELGISRRRHDFSDLAIKTILDNYFADWNDIRLHKTPLGELDLGLYQKTFKNAKFIYIIRSPFAVMCSRKYWKNSKYVSSSNSDEINEFLKRTNEIFESIKIIDKNLYKGRKNIFLVEYESLVNNYQEIMNQMFRNIELKPIDINNIHTKWSSFKDTKEKEGVYTDSVDKWKNELNITEKCLVYSRFMSNLHRLKTKYMFGIVKRYLQSFEEIMHEN